MPSVLRATRPLLKFAVCAALFCAGAITNRAQTSVEAFRKALREQAGFTAEDFSTLDQGQMVTRLLPVNDKREVAVFGLIHMQVPVEVFLQSVRASVGQKNNPAILQIGKFSNPPVIEDLQRLTLEKKDIEDLRRCTVGDCNLKLSAAMIERLRTEVNWSAPDYPTQVTLLFRAMILDYVRDYLARGAAALMEYRDRGKSVRLDDERRALLDGSAYFNQFAPDFTKYLRGGPAPGMPGVEDTICWSKIKFGFKPVVTLTQVTIYGRRGTSAPQGLIASQQIYADHYFDSSLALTAFVSLPGTGETYLLYTNRSRADALGGMLGGLTRYIVEREALTGIKTILQQTKVAMETGSPNSGSDGPGSEVVTPGLGPWDQWWLRRFFWWFFGIAAAVLLFWFGRRRLRRRRGQ